MFFAEIFKKIKNIFFYSFLFIVYDIIMEEIEINMNIYLLL